MEFLILFFIVIFVMLIFKCVTDANDEERWRNYANRNQRSEAGLYQRPLLYKSVLISKYRGIVALDTEMVGAGCKGCINMLARVSLVYNNGEVYDKYVEPTQPITDYRRPWSGIYPEDLLDAEEYSTVRQEVSRKIRGHILVGHDLVHDFNILDLRHPSTDVKDTALYLPFREILARDYIEKENASLDNCSFMQRLYLVSCTQEEKQNMVNKIMREKPSLKKLAKVILGREIQVGNHSSVEDARTALDLYLTVAHKW